VSIPLRNIMRLTALAAACALVGNAVYAVEWGGNLRAGPGTTKSGASRACYNLSGAGQHWRLGNECDFYGEFTLSQGFKADGVDYKATLMTNLFSPGTDVGAVPAGVSGQAATDAALKSSSMGIAQMYVEGKGYDIAPDTTFWAGKRYHHRQDVHIVDVQFTDLSGVGAGFDTPLGAAKLGLAWFKTDANATDSGNRFNVDLFDIPANEGGKLRFVGTYTDGRFAGGHKGLGLMAMHYQEGPFGGSNILWVQYARGSAGLNGNFGSLTADSNTQGLRILDGYTWQMGRFGGQALALWEQDKAPDALGVVRKQTNTSLGGRLTYGVTKNFKLLGELGHSTIKPEASAMQTLIKLTFAPALSIGPKFYDRPELRLYVTHARWNSAAGNVTGQSAFAGKTSGTSVGAQIEAWY
jgi:maltoporin